MPSDAQFEALRREIAELRAEVAQLRAERPVVYYPIQPAQPMQPWPAQPPTVVPYGVPTWYSVCKAGDSGL